MKYEKVIVLTRAELLPKSLRKTSELVCWHDFKPEFINRDDYDQADLILFLDGNNYEFLKGKHVSESIEFPPKHEFVEPADYEKWVWEQMQKKSDTSKLKPFNLSDALAGKPVVTRDGRPVKIAGYNPDFNGNSLAAWMGAPADKEMNHATVHAWNKDGIYDVGIDHDFDLFMAPTTRTVWVNIYRPLPGALDFVSTTHHSEQLANDPHDQAVARLGNPLLSRLGGKAHPIIIEE